MVCVCVCVLVSVVSDSLQPIDCSPPGLQWLCPLDFPGKNTGVGCYILLHGIFLTQGSNPCLLHWQADSLSLSHQGSPICSSVQFSSVAQSCPTLGDPMDSSRPGLTVHHQLLEFTQTHVH